MYNTLYRQTTCTPSVRPTSPGMHMYRGEELIIFPEVFPEQQDVYTELLEAVRVCMATNVMKPIHEILAPTIGDDLADILDDSIMYRSVGIEGSAELFTGRMAVQQAIGRILYDDTVMSRFVNDSNNCLVNSASMSDTRVLYSGGDSILVRHHMVDSILAQRYLRDTDVVISSCDDGTMFVDWRIPFTTNDMQGVFHIAENLAAALTIYYKLLTRFPSCRNLSTTFPGFRNS